jgi:uncharacterized protein (DUF2062 family)
MPRKFFRKYLPSAESVRGNRLVAMFGSMLRHPNLWHLNRDSVAGAVAIGLFSDLVPGPLQMLTALILAIPLRRNLPVALLMTLYTNPFTIVPLYLPFEMDWGSFLDSMGRLFDWTLALGKPLAVGLVALGLTLAALGYVAVQLGWRAYVVLAWRRRQRERQ